MLWDRNFSNYQLIYLTIKEAPSYTTHLLKAGVYFRTAMLIVFIIGASVFAQSPFSPALNKQIPTSAGVKTQAAGAADSLPKTIDVTVVVPFEYKQSSLNYAYTFKVMDSVAEILLDNDSITFSIDGYSYFDEGNDYVCYWLSFNRALAVKTYVLGRGVDSARLLRFIGKSKERSIQRRKKKIPIDFNCTAEIELNYPIPPPPIVIQDKDEDGIADEQDNCPDEYGYAALNGCPNKNTIIVPFEPGLSALYAGTYKVLDSVVSILRGDPSLFLAIEGHAYKEEGVQSLCERLAKERADIVRRYLLTRRIAPSRIDNIKSFSNGRPINAGRNPWEKARNSRAEIYLLHH